MEHILEQLGLSDKEIQVYALLLEEGQLTPNRISQKTGIKRTTVYSTLEELEELGLVFSSPFSSGKKYQALSPERLLRRKLSRLKKVKESLPEIEAKISERGKDEKPRVLYFKGVEGIKNLTKYRREELRDKKLTGFWATTSTEVLEKFGNFFHGYSKNLEKMNTLERGISPDTPEVAEYNDRYHSDVSPLFEKKILPESIYNPTVSFEFSENWLKIYDFLDLHGIVIESKKAAEAMGQIFELAWLGASNNLFSLQEGEELEYTFTSLSSLDAYWKDTLSTLRTRFPQEPVFFSEPHEFWIYLTPRGESQSKFIRSFDEQEGFLLIGGQTELDKKYKDEFESDTFHVCLTKESQIDRTKTITVIGEFVIESHLSKTFMDDVDNMFKENRSTEDIGEFLTQTRSPEVKISLKVSRNKKYAEKMREKIQKYF